MPQRVNWYYKRTRIQNILLVLIVLFIIVRTIMVMWNSPFYTTPSSKAMNIVKGVAIGIAFLGGLYFSTIKRGKVYRGDGPFDVDHKFDWLIIIWYLVWFYSWKHFGFWDETYNPSLYYIGLLFGFLVISFVWFERDLLLEAWWKIIE